MSKLLFLVGIRGSGKTTTLNSLQGQNGFMILKPSTTRPKRNLNETEYYFVDNWQSENYAWEIELKQNYYGMSNDELAKISPETYGITVFEPSSIDELIQFRNNCKENILTIGIDTISSIEEQKTRVSNDQSRVLSETEFINQRNIVLNCDVVLRGNTEVIKDAITSIIECLNSKGGVINQSLLQKFLMADILLENTTKKYQPASYDLRLGDDVWCQGKYSTLSIENPILKIPAYSYAIVSAMEKANLPCFISARFDLKNSLFFRGIILSNGPQIDPGYRGALFCMLYNGSDIPVGIKYGEHFATIEFITTNGVSLGYRDVYQGKTRLSEFMPGDAAVSDGGKILERTEKKINDVESEWKSFRGTVLTFISIALAAIVTPGVTVAFKTWESFTALDKKISDFDNKSLEIDKKLSELTKLQQKLISIEKHNIKKNYSAGKKTQKTS
ncbi:MAG: dCTP deaminase domain-containing protein [Nitrososphaeraceae archaeon]